MVGTLIVLGFSLALFSYNLYVNMILLLLLSLLVVLFLEEKVFMVWGGVMFLIVFLTGLFVVFSYVVSTSPKEIDMKKKINLIKSMIFFSLTFFPLQVESSSASTKFFFFLSDWSIGGLITMLFLLIVIIALIRSTYSKGGAFRKKF